MHLFVDFTKKIAVKFFDAAVVGYETVYLPFDIRDLRVNGRGQTARYVPDYPPLKELFVRSLQEPFRRIHMISERLLRVHMPRRRLAVSAELRKQEAPGILRHINRVEIDVL